jgi:polygalacturonase
VSSAPEFFTLINNNTGLRGRTVVLLPGTYNIGSLLSDLEGIWIKSDNITIRGATGDPRDVILEGSGFENSKIDEEMLMLDADNITIADLTLRESRCHGMKISGIRNLLVHNVRFINIAERSIKGVNGPYSYDCEIRYCHFECTKIPSANRPGAHADGNYIAGMDVMVTDGWVVRDCMFKNIKGATGGGRGAVFVWVNSRDMTVERCTFLNCDRGIAFGNNSGGSVTGGIVRNNFIVRGASDGIEMAYSSGIKIYNNTVYSYSWNSHAVAFTGCSSMELKNTIVFGGIYGSVTQANNIRLENYTTNWFENISEGDLHLRNTAVSAINRGGSLGDVALDWDGHPRSTADNQTDIGADEYNTSAEIQPVSELLITPEIILVYPNPFSTIVDISLPLQNANIKILNMQGKILKSAICNLQSSMGATARWDASDYPNGMYIIRVNVGNRESAVRVYLLR